MQPISYANTRTAQVLTEAGRGAKAPNASVSGEESLDRPKQRRQDRYVPEEQPKPFGRYRPERDEDGQLKIYFEDPAEASEASERPKAPSDAEKSAGRAPDAEQAGQDEQAQGPEKGGKEDARCACNTDRVDREIEELKKKEEALEKQLDTERDETQVKQLQRQLEQIKRELMQKDNDAYRRQHSTFMLLG